MAVEFYLHGENVLLDMEGAKFYCIILVFEFHLNNCIILITHCKIRFTFGKRIHKKKDDIL